MIIQHKGRTKGGTLDSQIQAVLDHVAAAESDDAKPLSATSPEDIRTAEDAIAGFSLPPAPVHAVDEFTVPGRTGHDIPVRLYSPSSNTRLPVLVFFHGGCWVFCDLDSHDAICRFLCATSGFKVLSVDYRLAPESQFPAAVEDAYDVVSWVAAHAATIGVDPGSIAVGGDSAGGNLAAAVSLAARDRLEPDIAFQLLIYPITDISTMNTASYEAYGTGYFLERALMEWAGDHYVARTEDRFHPYVSPLRAADLDGLPPALIQTAEFDILRDEAEAYARRLDAANVNVVCTRYLGMVHAFVAMAGAVDVGRIALQDAAQALQVGLSTPEPDLP